jgi:ABC-2 type transport system ATP-binding protein
MSDRLVFDQVTVEIPIYDIKARSLKHSVLINKVSKIVGRTEPAVGGTVLHGQKGIVTVRALDHVTFTAKDGDRIAVIGHNGAGKTTLLRVAAGIFEPTGGEVRRNGRVMPLFNILEGMMPDASGMEMIYTRGTLLGLSQREIDERVGGIVDFCQLGEYIEMPVRTYSTGMLVRLAFAITTSVTSELLIMDEIIGAGDAAFFERAEKRLKTFVEQASVLLIATHSADIVRKWCTRAMLFHHGRVYKEGPVEEVLEVATRGIPT